MKKTIKFLTLLSIVILVSSCIPTPPVGGGGATSNTLKVNASTGSCMVQNGNILTFKLYKLLPDSSFVEYAEASGSVYNVTCAFSLCSGKVNFTFSNLPENETFFYFKYPYFNSDSYYSEENKQYVIFSSPIPSVQSYNNASVGQCL